MSGLRELEKKTKKQNKKKNKKKIKSKRLFPPRGPGCSRVPRKKKKGQRDHQTRGAWPRRLADGFGCLRLPEPYPELPASPPRQQRGRERLQGDGLTRATAGRFARGVAWTARKKMNGGSYVATANLGTGPRWVLGCGPSGSPEPGRPSPVQGRHRCHRRRGGNFQATTLEAMKLIPLKLKSSGPVSFWERHENPQDGNVLAQTQGKLLCLSLWVRAWLTPQSPSIYASAQHHHRAAYHPHISLSLFKLS